MTDSRESVVLEPKHATCHAVDMKMPNMRGGYYWITRKRGSVPRWRESERRPWLSEPAGALTLKLGERAMVHYKEEYSLLETEGKIKCSSLLMVLQRLSGRVVDGK